MPAPDDYARIESALRFLADQWRAQPELETVARHVGLSPFHFQRLFQRWAGVSPKRFLQFLTLSHARGRLQESASLLQAAWDAGLSGPSRLHDLFVALEAVTPGDHRSGGEGLRIVWGLHSSPFGTCFVAATPRGICSLGFECPAAPPESRSSRVSLLNDLQRSFPRAHIEPSQRETKAWSERAFATTSQASGLSLFVGGTAFQVRVWRALLAIPQGCVTSYQAIAKTLDMQGASRAVGTAVGKNPISWLIPCHRVIRALGDAGDYRWGPERKRAMLGWEAARGAANDPQMLAPQEEACLR